MFVKRLVLKKAYQQAYLNGVKQSFLTNNRIMKILKDFQAQEKVYSKESRIQTTHKTQKISYTQSSADNTSGSPHPEGTCVGYSER